jgi:transporter family protein
MQLALLLLLTVICWGIAPIVEKIGLTKVGPLTALTIRSLAIALSLIIFIFLTGRVKGLFAVEGRAILLFTISGILAGLLGMLTYFGALKMADASRIVPVVASYPLITLIFSVLLLREGVSWPRVLGTLLIVGGIWLIK